MIIELLRLYLQHRLEDQGRFTMFSNEYNSATVATLKDILKYIDELEQVCNHRMTPDEIEHLFGER